MFRMTCKQLLREESELGRVAQMPKRGRIRVHPFEAMRRLFPQAFEKFRRLLGLESVLNSFRRVRSGR